MPILSPNDLELISHNAEQTRRMGMRLGSLLNCGDLIALRGDLGSGKTTLMQGIAAGWGSLDMVTSPTFVLVNVYQRAQHSQEMCSLFHLDTYRLMGTVQQVLAQAVDLDIETMLTTGILVVEWAERVLEVLPKEMLHIQLTYMDEEQRDFIISAKGSHYEKMIAELRLMTYGSM